MLRRFFLFSALTTSLSPTLLAQSEVQEQVKQTLVQMFDALRLGDSAMAAATFTADAELWHVEETKGKAELRKIPVSDFTQAVGNHQPDVWEERVHHWEIKVDGALATARTPYTFYLNDKMLHCGVDVFQLVLSPKGWKIFQLTDTRETIGCEDWMFRHTKPNLFSKEAATEKINGLLDAWHLAAARADEDAFFGAMTEDGRYLGTDATEDWQRDELKAWAKSAFDKASAWDFKPLQRNIYFNETGTVAWFDEELATWMGVCRGTGVLLQENKQWKIKHYCLSAAVPNDKMDAYIELLKDEQPTKPKKRKK